MKNFWLQVWNAEWFADTGLPLLVSLIALYVAYRFLKAQFEHDAGLIAEQFAHDRRLVAEERRRAYAQRYVEDARQALLELDEIHRSYGRDGTDEANFRAIFTRSKEVFERLLRSAGHLQIALTPSHLTRAAQTIATYHLLRIAVYAEAPELRRNSIPLSFIGRESLALKTLTEQWTSHLQLLAAILDTWEGTEPLPPLVGSLAELELQPVGPSDVTAQSLAEYNWALARWSTSCRGKFNDEIANIVRLAPNGT
ncbi:hypothetical protein AC1659_29045 [Rhodococcus erythropolis]|uniref:hypothetical protein n=1 Tax=Rhodococcus erythropolis TaxID=1833 RepID=UPI001BA8AB95|nr:hypothetical protein [Rhodococcus erythropolis]MBS2993350.1 hypothetical protein [Rhodococcus erythropolis]